MLCADRLGCSALELDPGEHPYVWRSRALMVLDVEAEIERTKERRQASAARRDRVRSGRGRFQR